MDKELEHLWKYFEIHSNQRMSLINYYFFISVAMLTGLGVILQSTDKNFSILGGFISIIIILTSFIFWKLDQRTSYLIKFVEERMSEYETTNIVNSKLRVFSQEDFSQQLNNIQKNIFTKNYTYGSMYRFLFSIMAINGLVGLILSVLKYCKLF
ncbi:hypothetical protein [Acinetobacter baylyi]|uniref:hypothetical protein n=1 Tax=Acinetobacter baylyi TaxID=202950 RepID=UPI000EA03F6F|nr:hypothetical protein [Acinetobacter baylyi]